MKTKIEIGNRLKDLQKELQETQDRFKEWDNHEDMDLIEIQEGQIKILKWVLEVQK